MGSSRVLARVRRGLDRHDVLLNRAEDRVVVVIAHFDPHRVAVFQEGRLGRAAQDRLDRADLGDAGVAQAAFADRLARAAVGVAVRDRARADDGSGAQRPGLGQMGDQGSEVEGHVLARRQPAERPAIDLDMKRQVKLAAGPGRAEALRRTQSWIADQRRAGRAHDGAHRPQADAFQAESLQVVQFDFASGTFKDIGSLISDYES